MSTTRYAVRQLATARSFTTAAIGTIAVCIGLNATAFALVNGVLFRPLPYPEPEQLSELVTTYATAAGSGFEDSQDGVVWEIANAQVTAVEWAAYSSLSPGVTLVSSGGPKHVQQERVSADFFHVLGVTPVIGRGFTPDEDRDGGPWAVILSYELWKGSFGGDRAVLGRTVIVRGEPHTVVGVMPAGFRTTTDADLWTPLRPSTRGEGQGQNYGVIARLRQGRGWPEANAEIVAISDAALQHFHPSPAAHAQLQLLPLQHVLSNAARRPLFLLWAAVVLVLVIGAVNTAGLVFARALARRREFATRSALGASALALVRQLAVEALVLSIAGAALGVFWSWLTLHAVEHLTSETFGLWEPVALDGSTLLVVVGLTLTLVLAIGVVPAWRLIHTGTTIPTGDRAAGAARNRPRQLLVVCEMTLTMALVVVTVVLIRSFARLWALDPGFDGSNVIAASVSLQDARYSSASTIVRLFDATLARARSIPGVQHAAIAGSLPYARALNLGFRRLDGPGAPTTGDLTTLTYVTPDYFETLTIPLRAGRVVLATDSAASEKVAVVNEAFARRFLRNQEAIGSHLAVAGAARTIVGIVGDVQQTGWNAPVAPLPAVYAPAAQLSDSFYQMVHVSFAPQWIVKTTTPADTAHGLRAALGAVDPDLVFGPFAPVASERGKALALQRVVAALLSGLAAVALGLCALGAYGMMATLVVERRREFGIRLALGADRWRTVAGTAGRGIVLAVAGTLAGALAARAGAALLRGLVWGIAADDSVAIGIAALTMLAVSAVSSVVPALAIARLDPATTLRSE